MANYGANILSFRKMWVEKTVHKMEMFLFLPQHFTEIQFSVVYTSSVIIAHEDGDLLQPWNLFNPWNTTPVHIKYSIRGETMYLFCMYPHVNNMNKILLMLKLHLDSLSKYDAISKQFFFNSEWPGSMQARHESTCIYRNGKK